MGTIRTVCSPTCPRGPYHMLSQSSQYYSNKRPEAFKTTDTFPYLGSVMSDSATIDDENNLRVTRYSSLFGRQREKVWKRSGLSLSSILCSHAFFGPSFLYDSECSTVYSCDIKKLQSFHMCCLWQIIHVEWQEHIPYTEDIPEVSLIRHYSFDVLGIWLLKPDYRLPNRVLTVKVWK